MVMCRKSWISREAEQRRSSIEMIAAGLATACNVSDYAFTNRQHVHRQNATDTFLVHRHICICHMNARVFCPECTFTSLFVIGRQATNHRHEREAAWRGLFIERRSQCSEKCLQSGNVCEKGG